VVTKSLKDVMSLHELGISAIAPQAESVVVDPKVIEKLKPFYKYIVFNGDWDAAGKQFMIKNRKLYGGLCLTFKDKERDGKDVSDFIKIHGMDQTRILFEELKTKCKLI
jgi:DNA primase